MPSNIFAAGVYGQEIDLSQVIQAVATSVGGIVMASTKGPINTPQLITNPADLITYYGNPDATVSFGHYAALAFLNQSTSLWVTRVVGSGAKYGGLLMQGLAPAAAPTLFPLSFADYAGYDFAAVVNGSVTPGQNLVLFSALGPGSYSAADLSIAITSNNLLVPAAPTLVPTSTGGTLPTGAFSYKVSARNQYGVTAASAETVTPVLVGASNTVAINLTLQTGSTSTDIYRKATGDADWFYLGNTVSNQFVDTGAVASIPSQIAPTVSTLVVDPTFTVMVYDMTVSAGSPIESYKVTFGDMIDGFGQQMRIDQVINSQSARIRVTNNSDILGASYLETAPVKYPTVYGVARTKLGAGVSGSAVTDANIITGWNLYSNPDNVPVRIMINGGYSTPAVQLAMDSIAHARQDAIAILDVPSQSQSVSGLIKYRNITLNLNSNRSALFAQDLLVFDQYSGKQLYVPPSGHVAGLCAKTDAVANPWFAIAGLNRGIVNVLGIRYQYDDGQRQQLAQAQVNYFRSFPGTGIALFEQKTLQSKQSALSWISVRRLLDTIEVAIKKALLYSVHEPNDSTLRLQIVSMINEYLAVIKSQRGLKDFLVVSDNRNNPASATGNGELYVDVYLIPTLPAEKVILRSVIGKQNASFQEMITAVNGAPA